MMDETLIIRGRKVVFERHEPVETLRYSLDVCRPREPERAAHWRGRA